MSESIRLSDEHGVNPTMGVCFYCHRPDNSIGLVGRLPKDEKAPHYTVLSDQPCDECQSYMKAGIMLVEVDGEVEFRETKNGPAVTRPKPSGTLAVVTEDAIERMIQPKNLRDHILAKRMAFILKDDWDVLGLPREDIDNRETAHEG